MHRVAAVGDKETSDLILNLGAKNDKNSMLMVVSGKLCGKTMISSSFHTRKKWEQF